ncbi:MAG: hypothetical protein PHV60_06920, partial [bacterium]|nr:hypothetical protein [bacterium]
DFILPAIYFIYPFMISMARAVGGVEWGYWFIVFWAKEFQYFIFFIVFYYLAKIDKIKYIVSTLFVLIALNDIVGLYKILNGVKDYYGIGAAFLEKDAPSLAGQVYYSCALFAALLWYLNMAEGKWLKALLFIMFVLSSICCLATGSKSNGFGMIVFAGFFVLFHDIFAAASAHKGMIKKVIKWIMIVSLAGGISGLVIYKWNFIVLNRIDLRRFRNPVESTASRYKYDLMPKIRRVDGIFDLTTGVGYMAGQTNNYQVNFTSAYDNQFVRNLLVLGIIGSIIWLIMLGKFGSDLRGSPRMFVFYITMIISYLAMGNGAESFGASKSGPLFWIITGILLGLRGKDPAAKKENI